MKILEKSVCREGYSRASSGNDWPGERLIENRKTGRFSFFRSSIRVEIRVKKGEGRKKGYGWLDDDYELWTCLRWNFFWGEIWRSPVRNRQDWDVPAAWFSLKSSGFNANGDTGRILYNDARCLIQLPELLRSFRYLRLDWFSLSFIDSFAWLCFAFFFQRPLLCFSLTSINERERGRCCVDLPVQFRFFFFFFFEAKCFDFKFLASNSKISFRFVRSIEIDR